MENYHEINFKEVGARIRKARRELKLTQEKAAALAFITGQFWSLLETGRQSASIGTYRQIAAVLNLTLDDLFYEDTELMLIRKNSSFDCVLSDCTSYERSILIELIHSTKGILVRSRNKMIMGK